MTDILISHSNEGEGVVKRLLLSVAQQKGVDFNNIHAIVCSDGYTNNLSDTIAEGLPFQTTFYQKMHAGVSNTRNSLLRKSSGEYVMFCDCDDVFFDNHSLGRIIKVMNGCDVVNTAFVQENKDGTRQVCTNRPFMIHGKAFKRSFLIDNRISFNDDLVVSGDPYFLWQTHILSKSVSYIRKPSYIWKYNKGSVSRNHKNHEATVLWRHIETYGLLFDRFSQIGRPLDAETFAIKVLLRPYFVMDSEQWKSIQGSFESNLATRRLSWWLKHTGEAYEKIQSFRVKQVYKQLKRFYGYMPFDGYDGLGRWRHIMEGME